MAHSRWASLTDFWKSNGLTVSRGATELDLTEFEQSKNIRIPDEFRSYLLHTNGMLGKAHGECDANQFSFWSLARIKSVNDEFPAHSLGESASNYFVFAVYFHWSWAYAVEMHPETRETGEVVLIGGLQPQTVATTFTRLVELYLLDDPTICVRP